jgi:hypothetical protein
MSKLIPRLVRDFDFELGSEIKSPSSHWNTIDYWFVKPVDFPVKLKARNTKR